MKNVISIEDPSCTAIVPEEEVSCDMTVAYQTNEVVDDFDISSFCGGLRRPEDAIRCAGRKGTTRLLWLHEFFVVNEGTARQPKKSVYQALQFLLGAHCPKGYVEDMTDDTRRDIWVLDIRHVPAHEVRHCSTRQAGYLFHTLHNDGDARTALLGKWMLEGNKSCGLKMTFDSPHGKSLGKLTVHVCWCTLVFSSEPNFIKSHFKY
jgi:hypothetical protein